MIDKIIDALKTRTDKNDIDPAALQYAINQIESVSVPSTKDHIQKHYNLCVLYELLNSSDREAANNNLESLNLNLSIVAPTNQPSVIALFDKVADLNFRAHHYEDAITLLRKAHLLEADIDIANDVMSAKRQFRRRWLLATCLEYVGLNIIENTEGIDEGESKILNAVRLLIGNKVLSSYSSAINAAGTGEKRTYERGQIVEAIMELDSLTNPALTIASRGDQANVVIPELDWNEPCLVELIEQWHKIGRLSSSDYRDMLTNVCHIVAHCLSELVRNKRSRDRDLPVYMMFRFSDMLMAHIGDDYVTCLATLAFERGERFSAINILKQARQDTIANIQAALWEEGMTGSFYDAVYSHGNINNEQTQKLLSSVEHLALINFYLWYFCVIANLKGFSMYKSEFKEYCQKSGDATGLVYYYTLNFKESLLFGFSLISEAGFSPSKPDYRAKIREITEAYREFNKHPPLQRTHFSIWDEWKYLQKTYQLFLKLLPIFNKPGNADFLTYTIIRTLADKGTAVIVNESLITPACFFRAMSSTGSFFFFGDYTSLIQVANWCSIGFTVAPLFDLDRLWHYPFRDNSIVFVRVSDENEDKCICFIKNIIEKDSNLPQNEKHSIFVCVGNLPQNRQDAFTRKCGEYRNNENMHIFSHPTEAFLLCVMFSKIEKVLLNLQKSLDSYMISPISKDVTYREQDGVDLLSIDHLLYKKDLDGITSWSLDHAQRIIGACLPSPDSKKQLAGRLNLKLLSSAVDGCNNISHIFVFESPRIEEGCNPRLYGYYFDIHTHLKTGADFVFSDILNLFDERSDLQLSLKKLSNSAKFGAACCNHCVSHFTSIDLNENDESGMNSLRQYIYSYIGVLMDDSSFLLFQKKDRMTNTRYYLCVLPKDDYNSKHDFVCSCCRALKQDTAIIETEFDANETGELESLLTLKNQIKHFDKNRKYFFISYRAKGGLRKLCDPVYRDVIYLQKHYPQLGFCIDVSTFTEKPWDEMSQYINPSNCIGAIIYLSPEYFLPEINGKKSPLVTDACFLEAKLIKEKVKLDQSFRVFPVFVPGTLKGTRFESLGNIHPKPFVEEALRVLQQEKDPRFATYSELFRCDAYLNPGIEPLSWQQYGRHFEKRESGNSDLFGNAMDVLIPKI